MRLREKHHSCIWCGKVFWVVVRSDEHVIPDCLQGRLRCPDVCKKCNSTFGSSSDWKLLNDERIYLAARDAGMSHDELISKYEAIATTAWGLKIKLAVRDGVSRVVGGLGSKPIYVGSDEHGHFLPKEIANLKALKKAEAARRFPKIARGEIDREVDRIVDSLAGFPPGTKVSSALLSDGFASDMTSSVVAFTRTYNEVDTDRAMAKSLFTILKSVLPRRLEAPMANALGQVKRFALGHDDGNFIHFARVPERQPRKQHQIRICTGPSGFNYTVILFDVLAWSISGNGESKNGRTTEMPDFVWEATDDLNEPDVVIRTNEPIEHQ